MQNMSLGGVDPAWDKVAGTFVDVQVPVVGGGNAHGRGSTTRQSALGDLEQTASKYLGVLCFSWGLNYLNSLIVRFCSR